MERWDSEAIEYTDVDSIRKVLIGRSVVQTLGSGGDYPSKVIFVLDDSTRLTAHATDGGCACSNGCFDVRPGNVPRGVITNVALRESVETWNEEHPKPVEPGSVSDGTGIIEVFVYAELGEQVLVTSRGGDNGYYGWGFWLSVERPSVSS
jgi:hypothetical protein